MSDFLPSFKTLKKRGIKIIHLLDMTSGLNHNDYCKLFQTLKTYYHSDLNKLVDNSTLVANPGTEFTYKSIDYTDLKNKVT